MYPARAGISVPLNWVCSSERFSFRADYWNRHLQILPNRRLVALRALHVLSTSARAEEHGLALVSCLLKRENLEKFS